MFKDIALLENTAGIGTHHALLNKHIFRTDVCTGARVAIEYALLQDHLHGRSGTAVRPEHPV